MNRLRGIIVLLTIASIGFAAWNMHGESYILSATDALFSLAIWSIFPLVNMLGSVFSKSGPNIGRLAYAVFITLLYALYAFNGSTSAREEGAAHMHIIMVPFLLAIITSLLILYSSIRSAIKRGRNTRNASVNSSQTQAR